MGRKSKQAGGNLPLTNYERSKKFKAASSETVAAISQYQLGMCALTTQSLLLLPSKDAAAAVVTVVVLCSPSGYLYDESALLEYLLRNTRELKRQKAEYVAREQQHDTTTKSVESRKRLGDFASSQAMVKITKIDTPDTARALKNVSYWLDTPEVAEDDVSKGVKPQLVRDRPGSPTTGNEVQRKDFWPVSLKQNANQQLVCALSDKPLQMSRAIAYWTTKSEIGIVALESIYDQLTTTGTTNTTTGTADQANQKKKRRRRCPLTDELIKHVRPLVGSQSTSVQRVERPGLGAK
jgi:hypothetical protein